MQPLMAYPYCKRDPIYPDYYSASSHVKCVEYAAGTRKEVTGSVKNQTLLSYPYWKQASPDSH